jgi:hypothetical protein
MSKPDENNKETAANSIQHTYSVVQSLLSNSLGQEAGCPFENRDVGRIMGPTPVRILRVRNNIPVSGVVINV